MCGICGIIGGDRGDLAESRVREMMRRIEHRGPDEEGILLRRRAVLGIRRLSIIDLGGGSQPVFNEDGTIGVVFNGEIYNFPELRAALESRGHQFRTHADTEVIVHAYEEWGERCPERLRGMFAFALWDGRDSARQNGMPADRVFLARDRLGIKPLYYYKAGETLLFASEVRALLASGLVPRQMDLEALEAYLLFGSLVEPATLVEGVFSLPPGHALMVSCRAPLRAQPQPYWNPAVALGQAAPDRDVPRTFISAARAVRPLLEQAVRSHLLADVPLGLFLSSGLDSTALAALAARERSRLHTFTVVFPEQEFNEAPIARQTSARLGTEHRELLVSAKEMEERLPEAVGALDQPSMDGVNTFFVSWAARQAGMKVALSGLGGDEVFGGYPTFRNATRLAMLAALARRVPAALRRPVTKLLLEVSHRGQRSSRSEALRKLAAVWGAPDAFPHPYFFTRTVFTPDQAGRLLSPEATKARRVAATTLRPWEAWLAQAASQAGDAQGDALVSFLELRSYTVDTLLRDTDAMSMHHSIEVRVPLLDSSLVEFVLALPKEIRRRRGVPKALLVEALGGLLPPEVVHQPKRTFTFPWRRWLRGPLGQQVSGRLGALTPSLAEVLDARMVQSIWQAFLLRQTSWSRPWSLFVLNEWVRRHLDGAELSIESARPAVATPGARVS
jgi:asparagine synthase (glutamine-hydrolysing)